MNFLTNANEQLALKKIIISPKIELPIPIQFNEETEYNEETIMTKTSVIYVRTTELTDDLIDEELTKLFLKLLTQLKSEIVGYNISIKTRKTLLMDYTKKITKFTKILFKINRNDNEKKVFVEIQLYP